MKQQDNKPAEIGARIIQARQETGGMRQEELAELLGVSVRSMQAYESGEVVPYKKMKDLERILSRPVAWFLHGEEAVMGRDAQHAEVMAELRELGRRMDELQRLLTKPE